MSFSLSDLKLALNVWTAAKAALAAASDEAAEVVADAKELAADAKTLVSELVTEFNASLSSSTETTEAVTTDSTTGETENA